MAHWPKLHSGALLAHPRGLREDGGDCARAWSARVRHGERAGAAVLGRAAAAADRVVEGPSRRRPSTSRSRAVLADERRGSRRRAVATTGSPHARRLHHREAARPPSGSGGRGGRRRCRWARRERRRAAMRVMKRPRNGPPLPRVETPAAPRGGRSARIERPAPALRVGAVADERDGRSHRPRSRTRRGAAARARPSLGRTEARARVDAHRDDLDLPRPRPREPRRPAGSPTASHRVRAARGVAGEPCSRGASRGAVGSRMSEAVEIAGPSGRWRAARAARGSRSGGPSGRR